MDKKGKIKGVYYCHGEQGYGVGYEGVTRIEEIQKPGNGAMIIWYQVYGTYDSIHGEVLLREMNSVMMESVDYFPPEVGDE